MISDPVIGVADQDAGGMVVPPDVAAPAKPNAPKCQLSAADPGLRCCPRNRYHFPHHNHGVQLRELSTSLLFASLHSVLPPIIPTPYLYLRDHTLGQIVFRLLLWNS